MLGKVRFATRSATEQGVLLHIYEFDPRDVMQEDGEGGEYAELSSVMVGGRRVSIDLLPDEKVSITVLLPVEHSGRMWFVEQP